MMQNNINIEIKYRNFKSIKGHLLYSHTPVCPNNSPQSIPNIAEQQQSNAEELIWI